MIERSTAQQQQQAGRRRTNVLATITGDSLADGRTQLPSQAAAQS